MLLIWMMQWNFLMHLIFNFLFHGSSLSMVCNIYKYLKDGTLPKSCKKKNQRIRLKKIAWRYVIGIYVPYKIYFKGLLLICLLPVEAKIAIKQVHDGQNGGHFNGKTMHYKLLRLRYYWPSMLHNCIIHIRKCVSCKNMSIYNWNLLMGFIQWFLLGLSLFGLWIL